MSNEAEQIKAELAALGGIKVEPQPKTEPDGCEGYTPEEINAHAEYITYCRSRGIDPGTLKGTAEILRAFTELGVL